MSFDSPREILYCLTPLAPIWNLERCCLFLLTLKMFIKWCFKNGVVAEWRHQLIRTRDKERAQMLPEKQSKLVDIISHATCSEIITLHFWSSIWNLNVPNLSTFYLNFRGSRWVTSCQSQFAIYCHLWVYHLAYTVVRLIWRTCAHLEKYRTHCESQMNQVRSYVRDSNLDLNTTRMLAPFRRTLQRNNGWFRDNTSLLWSWPSDHANWMSRVQ